LWNVFSPRLATVWTSAMTAAIADTRVAAGAAGRLGWGEGDDVGHGRHLTLRRLWRSRPLLAESAHDIVHRVSKNGVSSGCGVGVVSSVADNGLM